MWIHTPRRESAFKLFEKGLKHRSAGRRSNAARADAAREQILDRVREKYSGTIAFHICAASAGVP